MSSFDDARDVDGMLDALPEKPPRPLYERKHWRWRWAVPFAVQVVIFVSWVTIWVFLSQGKEVRQGAIEARITYCEFAESCHLAQRVRRFNVILHSQRLPVELFAARPKFSRPRVSPIAPMLESRPISRTLPGLSS